MTKLKDGDLVTVQQAADEYRRTGNLKAVVIANDEISEEIRNVRHLRGKSIYQIVHNDAHSKLAEYGANIGHFTLKGFQIESVAFESDDSILINGEIEIPDHPKAAVGIMDKFFFSELQAQASATLLNTVELEKFKELSDLINEGVNMMETIVEKGRV